MTVDLSSKINLENKPLQVGEIAPNFNLARLEEKKICDTTLDDFKNYELKIISTFPSIDTGVCQTQTKHFNDEFSKNKKIALINVSSDLPFAFKNWCAKNDAENLIMLSDYRDHSFAKSYGINICNANLVYRAVFVLDKNNKIVYMQLADKISEHLDYQKLANFINNFIK